MCDPTGIAIGAAIGAATSAATGQDPLMGAVVGGAMGGFMPGSVGVKAGSKAGMSGWIGGKASWATKTYVSGYGKNVVMGGLAKATGLGLASGAAMTAMFPEYEYPEYTNQQPIQAATAQNTITGSGGTQASALLASEIQRVKRTRAKTQTSALNTQAFQTTGLQLA